MVGSSILKFSILPFSSSLLTNNSFSTCSSTSISYIIFRFSSPVSQVCTSLSCSIPSPFASASSLLVSSLLSLLKLLHLCPFFISSSTTLSLLSQVYPTHRTFCIQWTNGCGKTCEDHTLGRHIHITLVSLGSPV